MLHLVGAALITAVVAMLAIRSGTSSSRQIARNSPAPVKQHEANTVPGTSIKLVSEEELLALFPDRPVALVGPPEDRRFVFLDEARNGKSRGGSGDGSNL